MIRINSVIIKLLPGVLLLSACSATAAEPGFRMDFSGQLPGQRPEGWASVWKNPVDDVIYITNAGDPAYPEKRQLLIDRSSGEDHTYYRCMKKFFLADMGTAAAVRISFRFKVECASLHDAPFELEFGPPDRKVMQLSFCLRDWGPNVFLYPVSLRSWTENWDAKQNLGEFRRNAWHKIELLLPYGGNSPLKTGCARLFGADGQPGKILAAPALNPVPDHFAVSIVPANQRKGALIFLADFVFTPVSEQEFHRFSSLK